MEEKNILGMLQHRAEIQSKRIEIQEDGMARSGEAFYYGSFKIGDIRRVQGEEKYFVRLYFPHNEMADAKYSADCPEKLETLLVSKWREFKKHIIDTVDLHTAIAEELKYLSKDTTDYKNRYCNERVYEDLTEKDIEEITNQILWGLK